MANELNNKTGLRAARAFAQWNLGDPGWADLILYAYSHPEITMRQLKEEKEGMRIKP